MQLLECTCEKNNETTGVYPRVLVGEAIYTETGASQRVSKWWSLTHIAAVQVYLVLKNLFLVVHISILGWFSHDVLWVSNADDYLSKDCLQL